MSTLDDLGWDDDWERQLADHPGEHPGEPGRVVRQDRGWVQVVSTAGVEPYRTRADRVGTPVVGDWVTVHDDEVESVLARRNELRRADPVGEGAQVLAANLDRVVVVLGLDRPVKAGRIQRALVQIHDAGADPVIALTKADLVDDAEAVADTTRLTHPDVDVRVVSAATGSGVESLRSRVAGGTVVLVGESGAGKSTLLNALAGSEVAETGQVRGGDAKGRHTTTRRELHLLPGGGLVVDTPGLRTIGIHADPSAVGAAFADVGRLGEQCRFRDCGHSGEPGCAVVAAVESGQLPTDRLADYRELIEEAEWSVRPDHERRRRR